MDVEVLDRSPIGRLVPISGTDGRTGERYDAQAFLPDPLPRSVELTTETWATVVAAEAALARLDQAARQIPEPALLRQPALRREAQSTSALEGTFAPFEDVLETDPERRAEVTGELHEILNYVVTAQHAFDWIRERPLTVRLIAALQRELVDGTAGEYEDAGQVRDRQVVIGPRDAPIRDARFIPAPPGDRLQAGFEDWIAWTNDPPDHMPPTIQAALAHYQFETLHPFSDGNGRIGRLLIVLQLMRLGVLREPILVVSPWFAQRRFDYQDGLLALSASGDWDAWVRFFASGVGAAASSTSERIDRLMSWQEDALERVRSAGISGVAERVAGELIGRPLLRAGEVAKRHGITHQGAMNALRRLAEIGLVEEQPRRGGVVFRATPVVAALSA